MTVNQNYIDALIASWAVNGLDPSLQAQPPSGYAESVADHFGYRIQPQVKKVEWRDARRARHVGQVLTNKVHGLMLVIAVLGRSDSSGDADAESYEIRTVYPYCCVPVVSRI